jgi:hypothetical protein
LGTWFDPFTLPTETLMFEHLLTKDLIQKVLSCLNGRNNKEIGTVLKKSHRNLVNMVPGTYSVTALQKNMRKIKREMEVSPGWTPN